MKTEEKNKSGWQNEARRTAAAVILAVLILSCLLTELFCQTGLRSGITANVIADDKLDTVNEDVLDQLDVFLNPWNIFSYFTQLSNFLTLIWALLFTFSRVFGKKRLNRFCEKPIVLISLTTYVTIAGGAVAVTLLTGLSRFQKVKNAWSVINNLISVVYHFVTPLFMWGFCKTAAPEERPSKKERLCLFAFPVFYAAATLVRGILIRPGMYPYFIFNPKNLWQIVGGERPYNAFLSYLVMLLIFAFGAVLFFYVGALVSRVLFREKANDAPALEEKTSDLS